MKRKISTHVINDLTTATEGNALIMRKGRTTLFSAKLMLFAMLKIENRSEKQYSIYESQYYDQLYKDTLVDYTKGLVAEIDVPELKSVLGKENSGSFYAALRDLFSIDPRDEKSLRNSWAVMMPNPDSGVLGYAEVVTACHYDTSKGKLFLKFSDEEFVKSQLWQIKSEYTELPFLYMTRIHSIHTYRLYEILYSEVMKTDVELKKSGEKIMPTEYSFKYSLGELQLMMGALDVTKDKKSLKAVSGKNPDYNTIAQDITSKSGETLGEYRSFRRYALTVACGEINGTQDSLFSVSYDVLKDERGRRVTHVIFFVKKRIENIVQTSNTESEPDVIDVDRGDFILRLSKSLHDDTLSFDDLSRIAKASDYDDKIILSAYELFSNLNIKDRFVDWFLNLKR